jgi:glycerophosphoinositol glycerophosphodiesterase
MSLLLLAAAGGGALLIPLLLLRFYQLPKIPQGRVDAFLEKARRGPIAHRGGIPENTLSAFRLSKTGGASGIEVDLVFSKDSHPVLLHDDTVDRTSNGHGRVDELTFEQLRVLDFGGKFGPEFAGERIPTLHEALDLCEELDLVLFLELKGGSTDQVMQVVKLLFQERPHLSDKVCVVSFWPWLLYKVRRVDSNIMCGLTLRSRVLQYQLSGEPRNQELWKHILAGLVDRLMFWSTHTWLWRLLGISLLLPHKDDILKKRIDTAEWYGRGVQLVTWTVNSRAEKEHFERVLKIPYLTDSVSWQKEVAEQIT